MSALRFTVCSTAVLLGAVGVFACASDDTAASLEPEKTPTIPTTDAEAAPADAGADADPCADAAACVPVKDCAEVDFCGTTFPVTKSIALNAIWGSSKDDVWVVGNRGTILHGDGTTFTPITSGTNDVFFSVWGTSKNDVWAVNGTSPVHSTGFAGGTATFEPVLGSTWKPENWSNGRQWAGFSVSPENVWIAGEPSTRFNQEGSWYPSSFWQLGVDVDGGAIWNDAPACSDQSPCTPMVRAFWSPKADTIWAVGMKGQTFVLDDPATGHWDYRNPNTSWDLESMWGVGDEAWTVGQHGTIRRLSVSDGRWSDVTSPTTQNLHSIWGSGPSDIWAVGDEATILHYDGKAWTEATSALLTGDVPRRLLGVWGSGADDVWIVGEGLTLHRTAASRRNP